MNITDILNKSHVSYDSRINGGTILRITFYTTGSNQYAFYYDTKNGNIWCNCSEYETDQNKESIKKVVEKYLK